MGIYVSVRVSDSPKSKGDLLESLAKDLLEAQDYEVETEVRKTGAELDLLCQNKTNTSKKLYVECKAYNDDKIQSEVITKLSGLLSIKGYREAWLITTSELGKDAKGLVDDIKSHPELMHKLTFYTPTKLIDALVSASVIKSKESAFNTLSALVKQKNNLGDTHLLLSPFGQFWFTEYLKGGEVDGLIFVDAKHGEIVTDDDMIANLQQLDFKFNDTDMGVIYKLLDPDDKTIESRRLRATAFREEYVNRIMSSSGINSTTVRGRTASIDDLFVYPDIEYVDVKTSSSKPRPLISSAKIISNESQRGWLIIGDDLSGKTTLSYVVQRRLAELGLITVRLDPRSLRRLNASTISKAVIRAFCDQYDVDGIPTKTVESFVREECGRISLIIDDFDSIEKKRSLGGESLMGILLETYGKVVVFANSANELEYTTSNEEQELFRDYAIYKLMQLGHLKRDELVEKWILVNSEEQPSKAELLERKDDFANKINIAIGTNYLPTYPFYALAVLEMLESGSKAQFQGSEYAALYGHLVNNALLSNHVKVPDLGFYNSYLAKFAQALYAKNALSIDEVDIEQFFNEYMVTMGLNKSSLIVHKKLIEAKILKVEDGSLHFNLPYFRYYFFAKYLSDTIERPETKKIIQELSDNLHKDDNANTIIFLVHHSKNSEIIDMMVDKAKSQFAEFTPQTLVSTEIESINNLITEDLKFVLKDESATEHRKKKLKRQDSYERNLNKDQPDSSKSVLDVYGQITSAFRTVDVLGKVTSNYYGELDAERKNMIMQELYELGFRSLKTFLENFEKYSGSLRSHLETKIDDKNITSASDKKKAANQIIYSFTHVITYSFIKRVSDSVVTPDLITTIETVLGSEKAPAAQLTLIATKLNFPGALEKEKASIAKLYSDLLGNNLARDLLRFLVLEHIYKFETSYQVRQAVSSQLNISFIPSERKRIKEKSH